MPVEGGGGGQGDKPHAAMVGFLQGQNAWSDLSDADHTFFAHHAYEFILGHPDLLQNLGFGTAQAFTQAYQDNQGWALAQAVNKHYQDNPPTSGGDGGGGGGDGGSGGSGNGSGGGSPHTTHAGFPGVQGTDYNFVIGPNGGAYIVYKLGVNGSVLHFSFKLQPGDLKAAGVDESNIHHVTAAQFKDLHYLTLFADVVPQTMGGTHPFVAYLRRLEDVYGSNALLHDQEALLVLLEGYARGWSGGEIQHALMQTSWYQDHNATQRAWLLDKGKSDRASDITDVKQQLINSVKSFYEGAGGWQAHIKDEQLTTFATRIASGALGTPDAGLTIITRKLQTEAEQVEGSAAWVAKQDRVLQQRQTTNKPEDLFQQLKDQAYQWLGPNAMPDNSSLKSWAQGVATGARSQGDWQQHLQQMKEHFFPWLSRDETWQDRASTYKRMAEQQWGMPLQWSDPVLTKLSQRNAQGQITGPKSYDDFMVQLRSDPRFWHGPEARDQGFQLATYLQNIFTGVGGSTPSPSNFGQVSSGG